MECLSHVRVTWAYVTLGSVLTAQPLMHMLDIVCYFLGRRVWVQLKVLGALPPPNCGFSYIQLLMTHKAARTIMNTTWRITHRRPFLSLLVPPLWLKFSKLSTK
jgi:hypothetical protein